MKYLIFLFLFSCFSINAFWNFPSTDVYIRDRVVMLQAQDFTCSGIQIITPHKKVYTLTAGHCYAPTLISIDEQHNKSRIKAVALSSDVIDLALFTAPNQKGIEIADADFEHEHIRTITHGGGHDAYTTDGELIEDKTVLVPIDMSIDKCTKDKNHKITLSAQIGLVCGVYRTQTMSNAFTIHGSSGGAVVDDSGKLVGISDIIYADGLFSGFVRLSDIKEFLKDY